MSYERARRRKVPMLLLAAALVVGGCTGGDAGQPAPSQPIDVTSSPSVAGSPGADPTPTASPDEPAPATSTQATPSAAAAGPPPTSGPVRLERWFDTELTGGRLRLGAERERTSEYRSYNVTYRSEDLRISGVIDIPNGEGPFPAVVLAHGYIDPAVYVRGQGMPRERRWLAADGYIAMHVDYRNHAASDDDPSLRRTARLGYSVDVLNAVNALRATDEVPVDDDRIALMGRSMGGGVVYRALEMAPGLVDAAIVFASVSSDEADNYEQFSGPSPYWDYVEDRWGDPDDNPDFWEAVSADQHFDRVTEPVLMHHGPLDDSCPPAWARHSQQAMEDAGVDVTLHWYEGEGHTFGDAALRRALDRSIKFMEKQFDAAD